MQTKNEKFLRKIRKNALKAAFLCSAVDIFSKFAAVSTPNKRT